MPDTPAAATPDPVARQRRLVQALRQAVYAEPDPTAHPRYAELVRLEAELGQAERPPQPTAAPAAPGTPAAASPPGRLLGPLTTKVRVETELRMQPLPTG